MRCALDLLSFFSHHPSGSTDLFSDTMASLLSATARIDPFYVDSPLSTPLSTPSVSEQSSQLGDTSDGLATLLRKATGKAHQVRTLTFEAPAPPLTPPRRRR